MAEDDRRGPRPIWEQTRQPAWVKALNLAGRGSRRLGRRWPRLDPDALLATARRRAGLDDFGDERFREGLRVLVAAFNDRDSAHAFGRIVFREYCVDRLVARLRVQADLTRHPEILDVPVPRPIVITGLPRSGTTFLHRLMSCDPRGRPLLTWEAMSPSPPPEPATAATDPRIARVGRHLDRLERLSPRLRTAHELAATSPEEDNEFFANDFVAAIFGFLFDVPDYIRWLEHVDLDATYRYARRQLQHLSWKLRGDYWVLKAPAHQYGLESLLKAFPDAAVLVTHRDPLAVVPSLCSLAAGFRGIQADRLDLAQLGAEFAEAAARGPERAIDARSRLDPSRFLDVSYGKLVADPVATVRAACAHFGYDFGPEYEARVAAHLAANPRHKHGVHRYHLDDFGLTPEVVAGHFAAYRAWLDGRDLV